MPTSTYEVTSQVKAAQGDLIASVGDSLEQTSTALRGARGATAAAKSGRQGAVRLPQGSGQLAAASEWVKASLTKPR